MKCNYYLAAVISVAICLNSGCGGLSNKENASGKEANSSNNNSTGKYMEGTDYTIFERVRVLDKQGFSEPVEAYSLLLPKGWKQESEIIWIMPGQTCAGNNAWLKASSPDNKYSLEFLPNKILSWHTNQETMQFSRAAAGQSPYCDFSEPVEATAYLKNTFVNEIGNPEIVKVEANNAVEREMQQMFDKSKSEMMQYGAADMKNYPTAITAEVKWNDNTEGFVLLSSVVTEILIQNMYNGTYDKTFTTMINRKTVFKYPAGEKENAQRIFTAIMASMRSNNAYSDAVNNFWLQVRQQKNRTHWEKIRLMDEQTRQIGERAIQQGNQRLKDMDNQMRSWEATQTSSSDKMHTDFIKTIREVENFKDETGKYEVASGYDHVWSRGDGASFVLSNNPNFDAASVLQDQSWKPMQKVE